MNALLQKSAKPTNESSPALQRWETAHNMTESAKRTTERNGVIAGVVQPSDSRTEKSTSVRPSAKALGYSHSVRFADAENRRLQQASAMNKKKVHTNK